MKLIKKIVINGKIVLNTGLHIGGANTALNIGGPDNFVVKNPINNEPYIPGSSLKGKMRSLIELHDGDISESGGPTSDPRTRSGMLFGTAGNTGGHPSRLIVRDAPLDLTNKEMFANTEMPYTETKTEATIRRDTAKATPRTFERVPAGAVFNVSMVLNVFDNEDEAQLLKTLKDAMKLLEDDYLGGSGSRGYGQVVFKDLQFNEKTYD